MKKLRVSIYKEALLLLRDIEGVIIMFLMPLILVVVVSLLQDRTFKNTSQTKIPTIIIDLDNDDLGAAICRGIDSSEMFELTIIQGEDTSILNKARADVAVGKYQVGIYIPANTTQVIKNRSVGLVNQQLPSVVSTDTSNLLSQGVVSLFFDPITKTSFKDFTRSALSELASKVEAVLMFETYTKVIDALTNQVSELSYPKEPVLIFEEDLIAEYTEGVIPNVVQHSIPAWTLFGMFLICIPIAGNIINERKSGCMARLKTIPVSYLSIMIGKVILFVAVCMLQALTIILVGIFFMPLLDLPQLQIHGNWFAVFLISLACACAATGYGVAIGTIASTHIQASTFGAVSSVILAAVGGVWVPVMIMSGTMRTISKFSPMNWGIEGYYKVFLRSSSSMDILQEVSKLFVFTIVCVLISLIFKKYRTS